MSLRGHLGAAAAAVGVTAVVASAAAYAHRRNHRAPWSPPGGRVLLSSSLSVRVLGHSGPPILLLHGLVGSGIYWGSRYDGLADGHRLVVPDLLGFGRSRRPRSGYGPDDHVAAVVACLDELGISEPVVVGGHSLGSLIALRLAAAHPQRVAAVIAFGPPLYPDHAAAYAHVTATGAMSGLIVLPGRVAEIACQLVCNHRSLAARIARLTHPALPPEIAADAVQHSWISYSQTLQQVILATPANAWLDEVHCPVHLVAGDRDLVIDHAFLHHLAAAHANVDLRSVAGGHDLPLTDAAWCAEIIGETAATAIAARTASFASRLP